MYGQDTREEPPPPARLVCTHTWFTSAMHEPTRLLTYCVLQRFDADNRAVCDVVAVPQNRELLAEPVDIEPAAAVSAESQHTYGAQCRGRT